MENRSLEERRCPDCGARLELVDDGSYRCVADESVWMAYGPKLLLKPALVTASRLALDLPWESHKVAA